MVGSRTWTALLGIAVSLAISVVAWYYFHTLLVFLVVPFIPFLFRTRGEERPVKTCPTCGFRTTDPGVDFCPRDGSALEEGST